MFLTLKFFNTKKKQENQIENQKSWINKLALKIYKY